MKLSHIVEATRHPTSAVTTYKYAHKYPYTGALAQQGSRLGLEPTTIVKLLDLEGKRAVTRMPGYCMHWGEGINQWGTSGRHGPALDSNYGGDLCVVHYSHQDSLLPVSQFTNDIVGYAGSPDHKYTNKEIETMRRRGQLTNMHGILRSVEPGVYNDIAGESPGFYTEMIINIPCRLVSVAKADPDSEEPNLIYLEPPPDTPIQPPTAQPLYAVGTELKFRWVITNVRHTRRGYVYTVKNMSSGVKDNFDEEFVSAMQISVNN